jgi:hypothetical protein
MASPHGIFTTADLVAIVYPDAEQPEKKHSVMVNRAAWNVARRIGWEVQRQLSKPRRHVFMNGLDLRSYWLGQMRCRTWCASRSIADLEAMFDADRKTERIKPGGEWWLQVERNKAKRNGDNERATVLGSRIDQMIAAEIAAL